MEHVSEKPKRGRPRRTDPEDDVVYAGLHGPDKTRRTILNWLDATRASGRLDAGADFDYSYLISKGSGKVRTTILRELYRIDDDETMLVVARHICENRLPTSKAVPLIRGIRLGNDSAPEGRLVEVILAAINAHVARYPNTTKAEIFGALREASLSVEHTED